MTDHISSEPYRGVRDFYPDDYAVLQYICDVWSETAALFGFSRYDASVLEPADLYSSKTSEEMVNEQTYTFTDRGDRRVTLRPEMTPTAARMVAKRRRELGFPLRWYSIPNLFRYERAQRGRLREHWQLNCDIFGSDKRAADIEIIALAAQIFFNFGASPDMFEVRINDRAWLNHTMDAHALSAAQKKQLFALFDRKEKINNFEKELAAIVGDTAFTFPTAPDPDSDAAYVIAALRKLGITNVVFSPSTVRGLTYYTGVVFEIFDTDPANRRALLGGGRYDNLTTLFGGDPVPGVGFGMGDVTMRDFLEAHGLLFTPIHAPQLTILPTDDAFTLDALTLAQQFRVAQVATTVDYSARKLQKRIAAADAAEVQYVLVVGDTETRSGEYTLKNLATGDTTVGTPESLIAALAPRS